MARFHVSGSLMEEYRTLDVEAASEDEALAAFDKRFGLSRRVWFPKALNLDTPPTWANGDWFEHMCENWRDGRTSEFHGYTYHF